jgi:hypothetical protein
MTDERPNPEKPTDQWVTGDEPMTGPQQSYLETLAREAGEDVPSGLTKAQASEMIDRLQEVTGRGEHGESHGERQQHESLADRVEQEGIVDQQAVVLDDIEELGGPDALP